MDGSAFDRLTRAVSTAGSRRRLIGIFASVGLGGLLTQLDDAATEASSAETKATVRRDGVLTQLDGAATPSSDEATEASGACGDVLNDSYNCGACGHRCDPLTQCVQGTCTTCARGLGPGSYCSATSPCCAPALCEPLPGQPPRCCLPQGAVCNKDALRCCSHYCGGDGFCM